MLAIFLLIPISIFSNEDLRILASDEFGIIPASTRLQVALATVASVEQNVCDVQIISVWPRLTVLMFALVFICHHFSFVPSSFSFILS